MIDEELVFFFKIQKPKTSSLRMLFGVTFKTDMNAEKAIEYAKDFPNRLENVLEIISAKIEMLNENDKCKMIYNEYNRK